MSDAHVRPAVSIRGEVRLAGDKSISHRAVLLAAVADGGSHIDNLAPSADVQATVDAVRALGVTVETGEAWARVDGVGLRGLRAPEEPIDARNAGTLARLLPGLLAGQDGTFTITGDESLSQRPMERVATPLRRAGVQIETDGGTLPMTIVGGGPIAGVDHTLDVASAQVQSALLLAGLFASGPTSVEEPGALRDHTERMLRQMGARVRRNGATVVIEPAERLQGQDWTVPGDPSSAAFLQAAATLLPESYLRLPGVLANPTRTGFVDLLGRMGARIGVAARGDAAGEPIADLDVEHARLTRDSIPPSDIPRIIDELPLVGLLAQFCKGETAVRHAAELRHKESDRIATTVHALRAIGINAEELADGFVVRGSGQRPPGGTVHSEGDHRIAMLGGVAGLVSRQGVTVVDAECVDVSFPGFFELLEQLAVR
jgi:3-phosphoshikimate 1-carboxyvinyltransferase